MSKTVERRQEHLKFDAQIQFLEEEFKQIPDHRTNNVTYSLASVLQAAFAMFSLKCPSLLDFQSQTVPERSNLRSIYRIKGQTPGDSQMRATLDYLDDIHLRALFPSLYRRICEAGMLSDYKYWQEYVLVSVDGVEHFSSTKVNCPSCTTRTRRNGKTSYHHAALAAVIVHPDEKEVFPIEIEPIIKQDGEQKNDCERNAAKRLCKKLKTSYPKLPILLIEDALYSNAPHLTEILENGWKYILNVKPDSHKSLFKQFEERRQAGEIKELRKTDENGNEQYFGWAKELFLNESAKEIKVNYLWYEETNSKGEVTRWTWITNLELNEMTVEKVMKGGRARWKIENETFNTLKNQGYNFGHNYGHGENNLSTVLAMLMFMAFLIDQTQQRYCEVFKQVWHGLKSKAKLWRAIQNVFRVLEFQTMEKLYRQIAYLYQIRLE
jgi:hypothetical protein